MSRKREFNVLNQLTNHIADDDWRTKSPQQMRIEAEAAKRQRQAEAKRVDAERAESLATTARFTREVLAERAARNRTNRGVPTAIGAVPPAAKPAAGKVLGGWDEAYARIRSRMGLPPVAGGAR